MKKLISLLLVLICAVSCDIPQGSRVSVLPYYNEASFTPHWFNSHKEVPSDFHKVSEFSLIDQNAETVTEKLVEGKVYVVDFFFTTCPGICPRMTKNMAQLQDAFEDHDDVLLLSHSVTPEKDTPEVLRAYADSKKVIDDKWYLLTGDRQIIYDLGRKAYFVEEDLGVDKSVDEFLHTENFVLVDQDRFIRGIYNGLKKSDVTQLIEDVKTLID